VIEPQDETETGPTRAGSPASQEVCWWPVHTFITAVLTQANFGPLPNAGTPSWRQLSDGDPRKLLAVAIAGVHHVLRVETAQAALARASQDISAAADWSAVARQRMRHTNAVASGVYIPRRKVS
jgi:hypothetical protein